MKVILRILRMCIVTVLFVSSFILNKTHAEDHRNPPEPETIETYEEDVTGDGHKEEINLKATRFSSDSQYYRDLMLVISSHKGDTWEIKYKGGYKPKLQFIDLNQDGVNDLFFQSPTGGNGGLNQYQLHTLIQYKLVEIPLPKQEYVTGTFKEDFQIELKFSPISKPIILEVKDRADKYSKAGIYDREGKLLEQSNIIVDPIAYFEPVYVSDSKGYGLKSYQQVSGISHNDQLGTIESLWYFERDKWIIIQSEWIPIK